MIKSHIVFLLFLAAALSKFCTQPQRGGVMSFSALGKRDHLTDLFDSISNQTKTYNVSATINGVSYMLTGIQPRYYYNDAHEKNEFVDTLTANVSGGILHLRTKFNFSYGDRSRTTGTAVMYGQFNHFSFTKEAKAMNGYLQWEPIFVQFLTLPPGHMQTESYNPPVTQQVKRNIENIINDHVEIQNDMMDAIIAQVNTFYLINLKERLNTQNIINENNITYSYKGLNITYVNEVYTLSLYNDDKLAGLKYFYLFELQGYMKACNVLDMHFDQTYGGVQEVIGNEVIKATFFYALDKGWMDVTMDNRWDSQIFQFYVGDVANFISSLRSTRPDAAVTIKCNYDSTLSAASLTYQSKSTFLARFPYRCMLQMQSTNIVGFTFNATYEIDFLANNETLRTVIDQVFISELKFQQQGGYEVTDPVLAGYYLLKTFRSNMEKRETLGTGFPTVERKYPLITITPNYTIIYDGSEN